MRWHKRVLGTVALMSGFAGCTAQAPRAPLPDSTAHTLVYNVNGYRATSSALERFSALAFDSDGRVIATYQTAPADDGARRIDGGGATLLPGLIDAHAHVEDLGHLANRVDLMGAKTLAATLARIETFARTGAGDGWVLGRGWNQVLWEEQAFPTAADLDALDLGRPIWLRRVDGHAGWANSLALERAGIDNDTPDPPGGRILRDTDGRATGVLIDKAMALVDEVIPPPTRAKRRAALQAAFDELARLGITSVHDAGIDTELAEIYYEIDDAGAIPIRVYAMLNADAWREFGPPQPRAGPNHLEIRSIKAYLDGALGSRGAALLAPYDDDPGNEGLLFADRGEFAELARAASAAGYQVNVHAIGDAANRIALDGFAALDNRMQLRHRVEHAQIIAPDDIPRFAELGVIASMQPIHATSDMNMAGERVGERRILGGYAWRTLLDSGAVIASGSDFPVEPPNPFYGLHAAITRQDRDGEPPGGWYAGQRMSRTEALRSFTRDAAYAAHQETWLGTLDPGQQADFILVDRDVFEMPVTDIWRTEVLQTWVGGKQVYDSR